MIKVIYTTKEAFTKAAKFFRACCYEWKYEEYGDGEYLVTVFC